MFNINNLARRATISLTGGKDDDNNELYKHKNLARRASLSNNQHKRAIERANLTRTPNTNNNDNNRRRSGNKIIRNGIVNNMRSSFTSSKSTAQSTQTSTSLYNGYKLPNYDTYNNNHQHQQQTNNNNDKEECCVDPLMYRLQHQQSILKEKHDRRKLRRSISDGEIKERDPFDLWGTSSDEGTTSTSNDKGSEKDKGQDVADDIIHDIIHGHNKNRQPEVVDVAGWGGNCSDDDEHEENNNIGTPDCSGWEGSRSTGGDLEEEEEEEGMYIDYGSVKTEERKRLPQYLFTPPEMGGGLDRIRKRQTSQKHDVEEEEQYEDDENDDDDNSTYTHTGLFVDFGGIVPQDDIPTGQHKSSRRKSQCTSDAQIHTNSHRRRQNRERSNSITSRGSYKSLHSDLSSVTNFTNWPNDDDDDEDENDYFDNYEESRGYETSEGTSKNRRASLAELEDILSNLEKEALTPTSSLYDNTAKQQEQTKTAAVIDKSLQIPSMLSPGGQESQQQKSNESQQKKVSPTPSVKSIATTTTTQRRLTLSKEEENDPRLFQLNQSSIEELQIELSNMQSQSKSNLELSWGDTERMRCEVTELDDKITEIKKKLDDANNKLVSSSSRSSSFYPPKHTTRHFVETNFGTSKSVCPPRVKLRRRRRRTIEGGSMRFSQTVAGSFVANADSLLGLIEGGEETNDTIDRLPKSIIDLANIRPQLNRRSISSRSCGDKSQEEEELLGDSLDDSNEVKSFCTAPAKSSFKADKYSAEALRALLDADDNDNNEMLVGDVNQSNSSIISSDLGIDLDIHSRDALLSTDGLLALTTTSSSTNSKPEIDDKIFKSLLSFPTPDATDDEGQSGVFYPAPNDGDDEEDSSSDSSVQSGVIFSTLDGNDNDSGHYPTSRHESVAMASLAMDAMEDFDFDPLKSLATNVDNNDCKSVKSIKSTKSTKSGKFLRRPSMNRRPSIMGFFDSNDDLITDVEPPPTSAQPDGNPLAKQVGKNRSIERIKSRIEEKEEEMDRLTRSVQDQEDKIQTCELNIDEANINCSQKEGQLKDKESTAQQEVKVLMQKDGDSEAKLEDLEDAEKDVLLRERELIKQLANMPEVCLDNRDGEIELEKQLSLWQQKYDNIQEKAIGSLSSLLNEFDTLGIPNLQEDIESSKRGEDTVSADIIARYDVFLDKESELVRVLSERDRLITFEMIKSQCEQSVYVGKQLSKLQADLAIHSLALTSMIDGDDQGTDVTSSSTASERLSIEKEFVDAVISHLNTANRNQEELILETLPKIVQHLKYWDKIILPGSSSSSSDIDCSTNAIESLPMLAGLVKNVEETLAQVKANILDEHSKYIEAMERADSFFSP